MTIGRPWDGPRDPNCDYFDDYMGDNEAPAIFGPGMKDYDGVRTQKSRQGLQSRFHCRACSLDVVLDVEWHELFIISMMPVTEQISGQPLVPQNWTISEVNRAAYPNMHCRCGALCALMFTPLECQKEVETAIASRVLDEQQLRAHPAVQAIHNMIMEARQRAQQAQQGQQIQRR